MSPSSFTRTLLRTEVVDFAIPIADFYHKFFIKNPRAAFNWLAFLEPLTANVWAALAAVTVVFAPVMTLLARGFGGTADEPAKASFGLVSSLCFVASTITLARPWSRPPETGRARILFFVVLLAGSLVFWHWEAMIISYLAVRLPALPFRNMEELMAKTDKR